MDFNKELDTRGLNCPLPILKAKKALADMASGEVLKVVATDPGSVRDFQAFARQTGNELLEQLMDVARIVEKPAPEDAPSRLGVAGRYILTPGIFHEIANQPRGVGGEIQLTDGIAGLLRREKVFAYRYDGKRYDCGSKEGFLQANVELALEHPEMGPAFRDYLKTLSL